MTMQLLTFVPPFATIPEEKIGIFSRLSGLENLVSAVFVIAKPIFHRLWQSPCYYKIMRAISTFEELCSYL